MAISSKKKRFEISMLKEEYQMISKFAVAHHMSKSDFIVSCCMNYIQSVVNAIESERQAKEKKGKN